MGYDLVIRDGMIVDGSGAKAYAADVGVKDGLIVEIGKIAKNGAQEIDAAGQVVSPGFIDGHTHFDAQVNWDAIGTSSCWHGITSVVMGNCGFSLAPCRSNERALVVRNLERAEDISADAMAAGIEWKWETFPEYLDVLEKLPKGINYSVYMGHSALRTWAMSERAFEQQANDDDLKLMQFQLSEALKAGAMGLSTSRTVSHETADGRPVASRIASWNEVKALVGTMGSMRLGILEIANETDTRSTDPDLRAESHHRLIDLAAETKVPITFGINRLVSKRGDDTGIATDSYPEVWRDMLSLLDRAAAAGGTMFGQTNTRDVSILLSFRTQLPFDHLPVWKELRARPLPEQAKALRDPAIRAKLIEVAENGPYGRAIGNEPRKPDWRKIRVLDSTTSSNPTLAALSERRGVDPVTLMIDLSLESDFNQFFLQFLITEDPDGQLEIMRHPKTIMTFSDSGAHVSQISDCSIHTHLLSYWVRDRRAFTLEEAVHMITGRAARYWGFSDRGLLKKGMKADINVFDPSRIAPRVPEVVHDLPGGAKRLIQRADGVHATIVNGQVILKDGEHTGALPGLLLRRK